AVEQKSVASSTIVLDPAVSVGVAWIKKATALIIRRERVGLMRAAGAIFKCQPGLLSVRARQPAKEMVEGPVFHHHHDHMLEPGRVRRRQRLRLRAPKTNRQRDKEDTAGGAA